jgi:hypothetical protein
LKKLLIVYIYIYIKTWWEDTFLILFPFWKERGNIFYSVVAENMSFLPPNRKKTPQLNIKIAQKLLTIKTPDFELQRRKKGKTLPAWDPPWVSRPDQPAGLLLFSGALSLSPATFGMPVPLLISSAPSLSHSHWQKQRTRKRKGKKKKKEEEKGSLFIKYTGQQRNFILCWVCVCERERALGTVGSFFFSLRVCVRERGSTGEVWVELRRLLQQTLGWAPAYSPANLGWAPTRSAAAGEREERGKNEKRGFVDDGN